MNDPKPREPLGERRIKSLEEALLHANGEIALTPTPLAEADEPSAAGGVNRARQEAPR